MKKIIFASIAALALTACGGNSEGTTPPAGDGNGGTDQPSPVLDETGGDCGDGRVLSENQVCP